ncbi:MAG: flippase [Nanoarchaeota archaeon]
MTSFAKRAFHGAIAVIILGMVSNFLAYVLRLVLARSLPKEDFGLFYSVVALVGLLYILTHLGLNDALSRHISASRVKGDISSIKAAIYSVMGIQLILAIIVVAIIATISPWLSKNYFHHAGAALVLIIQSSGMILLPFETLYLSVFQGYQEMGWYGSVNLIRMASVVIFSIVYLWLGLGVLSPALAYLSWYFIAILIYSQVVFRRLLPGFFRADYVISRDLVTGLFAFGLPVIFSSFAGVIVSYTDTIMLTWLRGSLEEVAIYNVALPTASILWFFSAGLAIVLFPITSELWERKYHDHLREGIELVYRYAFMLITPLALALSVFPETVIVTLFGPGFEAGAPVLRLLSIGAILFTFGRVNEAFFSGMGEPKTNFRIICAGAIANLLLNIAFVPKFGMMGAASATVISFGVIFGMGLYSIRKRIDFHVPWSGWARIAVSGAVFLSVLTWFKNVLPLPVWPKIIIGTLMAFAIYVAVLLVLRAVTIKEIKTQLSRVM